MNTLLLDQTTWDLVVDAFGNIAMASDPYSQAQDAASNCKTFTGEEYYDTTQGIPFFSEILGERPSISLLKQTFAAASLTVPGVVQALCFITSITNRLVTGQIQIMNTAGQVSANNF